MQSMIGQQQQSMGQQQQAFAQQKLQNFTQQQTFTQSRVLAEEVPVGDRARPQRKLLDTRHFHVQDFQPKSSWLNWAHALRITLKP